MIDKFLVFASCCTLVLFIIYIIYKAVRHVIEIIQRTLGLKYTIICIIIINILIIFVVFAFAVLVRNNVSLFARKLLEGYIIIVLIIVCFPFTLLTLFHSLNVLLEFNAQIGKVLAPYIDKI